MTREEREAHKAREFGVPYGRSAAAIARQVSLSPPQQEADRAQLAEDLARLLLASWRKRVTSSLPSPGRSFFATRPTPRLAIVGHGRAGKDTMADWLAAHTPLRHPGSTSVYLLKHYVAWKYDLTVEEALAPELAGLCAYEYGRRHARRMEWYDLGVRLRDANPGILLREALAAGDLLVGLRDTREVDLARAELTDLVVWVDNPRVPPDPTVNFGPEVAHIVIVNDTTIPAFHRKIEALCRFACVPVYTSHSDSQSPVPQ
jgi:hypothetical protein